MRAVLIEDFTGQRCVNCPNAAAEIEKLKAEYGDSAIIAVGIHSGPLALYTRNNILGLRTEEGDAYYDHWGITQEPMGYVNRRGNISTVDQWATLIREAIQMPTDIQMGLTTNYDPDTRQAHIALEIINGAAVNGHLQLWLIESNITAIQMMPDGSANQAYNHQHVFRKTVNGQWGETYQAAAGEITSHIFNCNLDTEWVPENMAVVAFVYDNSGVVQVTEKKIMTTHQNTDPI